MDTEYLVMMTLGAGHSDRYLMELNGSASLSTTDVYHRSDDCIGFKKRFAWG